MNLATPLDTICRLIVRGRELEAQVPANETDDSEEDPDDADDRFAVREDATISWPSCSLWLGSGGAPMT